jgi:leucyl aminopeptidase
MTMARIFLARRFRSLYYYCNRHISHTGPFIAMLLTCFSQVALLSRRRILRGGQALRYFSYDFLEESLRWRERCTTTSNNVHGSWLIPLSPKEWSELIESVQSPSTKEWLESQASGLIRVPASLIPDLGGSSALKGLLEDATDSASPPPPANSIIILRQEADATASEGGLLPPSKQWSSVAKATSPHGVHQVQLPAEAAVGESVASYLTSCYSFHRYKTTTISSSDKTDPLIQLSFPESKERKGTEALMGATYWAQDLISTPANDLTPGALQRAAEAWACSNTTVEVTTVVGNDLLTYNGALSTKHGCGMIHAVGRAAMQEPDREPRLIQLRYTPPNASDNETPIAIVGKGVTYDTGGLNLKPGASMLNMKKDMGGAALALGLMRVLVETNFPRPIHCWIPAVENAVDGTSYRPGDILTSVNGITTEIGNTDAEGRLVLADALAMACAEQPDLILDFATLTGAQRVALGLEIPGVLVNQPDLMPAIMEAAKKERDPVWQLPLWEGYRSRMKSKVADLRNIPSDNGMGGCITAALYLNEFINDDIPWIHVDFNGLDNSTGLGQAQSLKTMSRFLTDRYSK